MARLSLLNEIDIISTSPFIGAELTIKIYAKKVYRIGEVGIQTFPRQFGKGLLLQQKNILKTIRDMKLVHKQIFSKTYDLPKSRTR